jgi:hypothetical protein
VVKRKRENESGLEINKIRVKKKNVKIIAGRERSINQTHIAPIMKRARQQQEQQEVPELVQARSSAQYTLAAAQSSPPHPWVARHN